MREKYSGKLKKKAVITEETMTKETEKTEVTQKTDRQKRQMKQRR